METITCPQCGKHYIPDLALSPTFNQEYDDVLRGKLGQDVWPKATAIQREQLVSGICSDECWDAFEKYRVDDRGGPDRHDESVG